MQIALISLLFVGLLAVSLAASAWFLWLACRWCKVAGVTYGRSIFTIILIGVAGLLLDLVGFWTSSRLQSLELIAVLSLVGLAISLAIQLVLIKLVLRPSLGKTFLVWLIWFGLGCAYVVVFVVVVRQTLAEAFIIPTGGMAETLWGYEKTVTCPACGFTFPVNCSEEMEGTARRVVGSATCPNCRREIDFTNDHLYPTCNTGDRILVDKCFYHAGLVPVRPLDVVVFRFPEDPRPQMIYVKRLMGMPGQTMGIYYGDVYTARGDPAEGQAKDADDAMESQLPQRRRMHRDRAKVLLEKGDPQFEILRKSADRILALRRIVYDNDFPAKDLSVSRWAPEAEPEGRPREKANSPAYLARRKAAKQGRWVGDGEHRFTHTAQPDGSAIDWLRYRHILRGSDKPQLITDFMGYNSNRLEAQLNWVGDLILECEFEKAGAVQGKDEVRLELAQGSDRFQARFDLPAGRCALVRLNEGREEVLAERPVRMNMQGTYHLRFANVDQRLTVWVDEELPFGDGQAYEAPRKRGPSAANDLDPAGVGVHGGGIGVGKLKLWRDTYYTYLLPPGHDDPPGNRPPASAPDELWSDPDLWKENRLNALPAMTFYVQPGHYFVLGDNSPQSSDSRSWGGDLRGGLVPESDLLGGAVLRYYPIDRAGRVK